MGSRLLPRAALVSAFLTVAEPASAAVFTTSASTCSGTVSCPPAALQPFDPALGVLENIILDVDVQDLRGYFVDFQTYNRVPPYINYGSAYLSYTAPFHIQVNGIDFTFQVSGEQSLSFATESIAFSPRDFVATGKLTTNIDHALLDSFINPTNCYPGKVCAVALTPAPLINSVVQYSDNLRFSDYEGAGATSITLRYVYRPLPEPATWAMMLLGFAGIGAAMRRRKVTSPA